MPLMVQGDLSCTMIVTGMVTALVTVSGVAAKLYVDLKDCRADLSECQKARIDGAEQHSKELRIIRDMLESRMRKRP